MIRVSIEFLTGALKAYEDHGGDELLFKKKQERQRRFLEQIPLAQQRVANYLRKQGKLDNQIEARLKLLITELEENPDLNNFPAYLPWPSEMGYIRVDNGQKKIRRSDYAESLRAQLDQPCPGRGSQPFWQKFQDVHNAVKDLVLEKSLSRISSLDHELRSQGRITHSEMYDKIAIPVYLLLRISGYSSSELTQ